jgi:hypothetical protein
MYTYTINVKNTNDATDPGLSTVIMTVARLDENYEFEDDGSAVTIRTSANICSLLDTCDAVISYDVFRYTEDEE